MSEPATETRPKIRATATKIDDPRAERVAQAQAARDPEQRSYEVGPDGIIKFPPRDKRVMDGANESKISRALTVAQDHKNWAYRWVNDDPGRIPELQARDWETVPGQERVPTGLNKLGQARHKVLMRKPKPYFDEDMRARTKRSNDKIKTRLHNPVQTIRETAAGNDEAFANGGSPFYDPAGAVGGGDYGYRP